MRQTTPAVARPRRTGGSGRADGAIGGWHGPPAWTCGAGNRGSSPVSGRWVGKFSSRPFVPSWASGGDVPAGASCGFARNRPE